MARPHTSNSATNEEQNGEAPPALMPRLRFPQFQSREPWNAVNGDRLFDPIERRPAAPGLPVLAITQEHGAIPRDQIDYHVSVTDASLASYKEVRPKDFIISLRSFQGGIEYSHHRGICSPAYVILNRKGDGSDDFYRHLFKSERFIQQLTRNIEGLRDGKMISYKQFSEQLLPEPRPDEQQKIADCLTSLDEAIAAQGRKVEALKAHKKGLMQHLFPQEGQTLPRLRFPEFRDGPEWEPQPIGNAATFFNGRAYAKEELLEAGRYKVLRVGNFFTSDHWYYSDLELDDTKYCDSGDLLYAWSASFGPRIWTGGKTIYHYHIWKVVESEGIDRRFLFYRLEWDTEEMRAYAANGIGMFHITKGAIESWMSAFPVFHEQQRIADCLASLDGAIASAAAGLAALKTHKQGLMQGLFPAPAEPGPEER